MDFITDADAVQAVMLAEGLRKERPEFPIQPGPILIYISECTPQVVHAALDRAKVRGLVGSPDQTSGLAHGWVTQEGKLLMAEQIRLNREVVIDGCGRVSNGVIVDGGPILHTTTLLTLMLELITSTQEGPT